MGLVVGLPFVSLRRRFASCSSWSWSCAQGPSRVAALVSLHGEQRWVRLAQGARACSELSWYARAWSFYDLTNGSWLRRSLSPVIQDRKEAKPGIS